MLQLIKSNTRFHQHTNTQIRNFDFCVLHTVTNTWIFFKFVGALRIVEKLFEFESEIMTRLLTEIKLLGCCEVSKQFRVLVGILTLILLWLVTFKCDTSHGLSTNHHLSGKHSSTPDEQRPILSTHKPNGARDTGMYAVVIHHS